MSTNNYINASQIINSSIPTSEELELIELIVNHRIDLGEITLSFADILNDLNIEFSPVKKTRTERIITSLLSKGLQKVITDSDALNHELIELGCTISRKASELPEKEVHDLMCEQQFMQRKKSNLDGLREKIERFLSLGDIEITNEIPVLGEFFPSPKPSVVLYYNNFNEDNRCYNLIGTFVHEIIRAWFYFMSDRVQSSVLEVDETMVEFSTLFFLKHLKEQTTSDSHKFRDHILVAFYERYFGAMGKQRSIGAESAHGYGYFLYETLGDQSKSWIEEYSSKSSKIANDDDVQYFMSAVSPCYPFKDEHRLKEVLERIIFNA